MNTQIGDLVGEAVGSGPTVVLLHAGGERRTVWRPVARLLAAHGYRCVAYDLRGHGGSEVTGADRIVTHAKDVAAMILAEPFPVTVVGASLGGLAAMLALNDPIVARGVVSVVLVDVVPHLEADHVRDYLNEIEPGHGNTALVEDILVTRREQLLDSAAALATMPTLLVRGGESALPAKSCHRFTVDVPDAEVKVLEGAGHLVARDDPAALGGALLEHLESDQIRTRRINWLFEASGAEDVAHPGGSLRSHLHRTGETLRTWEAASWIVDAGLLHAAYGTEGFPDGVPGMTPAAVLAASGPRTSELVRLYDRCDRARTYPTLATSKPYLYDRVGWSGHGLTPEMLCAFAELTAANELDVVSHNPAMARKYGDALYRLVQRWQPLLSAAASTAWGSWAANEPGRSITNSRSDNTDPERDGV